MKQAVSLPLLIGLALFVPRCGGDVHPQNGSESHFLDHCDATGDCGSGLECVCNVCTRVCTGNGDCASLSSSAVCGDARTLAAACTSESDRFCQAGQGACEWPARFDAADAAPGACRAARFYLSCRASNDNGTLCPSDDPSGCPGANSTPGVTYSDCENQCNPGEYALGCGGLGPAPEPTPQPPAECRLLPPNPGGGSVACCPCGSGGPGSGSGGSGPGGGGAPGSGGRDGGSPPDAGTGGSAGGPSDAGPTFPRACDADGGSCFCESLLTCGADEGQQGLPLGSRGYRTCGVAGDGCSVNYYTETEGGLSLYRCYAAPGAPCSGDPWSNLFAMPCDLVLSCNLLLGDCPADVLDCAPPAPAPSCAALDPGVDACCAGYGVTAPGGTCGCICPTTPVPLFGSVEACQAACGTPPITCAAVDRLSFGDCATSLGYGYDGTGCIGISGCPSGSPDPRLFASRDECWAGCNRSCTDVEVARAELRERVDGCVTDDDCMWVESNGPPYDHCSCLVAVNRNLDIGVWREVNLSYGCFEQGGCCDAPAPPAACIAGRCAPRP